MSGTAGMLQTVIAFLGALFLLILVHEWGHFWVARRAGVKVLRFSLGMGKPIFTYRSGPDRTEWTLGAFPIGGYVRMLDEREGPVEASELHRAFNRQSLPRRCAIVLAGPVANFLLAILIYWGLYLAGIPGFKAFVGAPPAGTPAALAGFHAGEQILSIGDTPVATWSDLQLRLVDEVMSQGRIMLETRDEAGHLNQRSLDLTGFEPDVAGPDLLTRLGLQPWDVPIPPRIGRVLPDSPAAMAGLRSSDEITQAGTQSIQDWEALVAVVRGNAGRPLVLQGMRDGTPFTVTVTPRLETDQSGVTVGRIGVAPAFAQSVIDRYWTTVRYGPWDALTQAVKKTADVTRLTFKTFGKMVLGEASWKNVGGPIQIADYAGQTARMGWIPYFSFLALISISLGALNLLPIPLLDGGHLMYYVVEFIKGSPISDQVLAVTQRVGLALLAALMGFALYNDIHRLLLN